MTSAGDEVADDQPWNHHQIVFVGGLHRSGTTLLADAISGAPGASGLVDTGVRMDEGQFLQDVYPIGRSYGGPTRWAFDSSAHLTGHDVVDEASYARRLWSSWSPYWDLGRHILVEKTPLNLLKTTFLQAIFPRAKFVVVTRHPITQSQAVRKWSTTAAGKLGFGFPKLVEHWLVAHERFAQDATELDAVHVVRYEHFVSRPAAVAAGLSQFLQTQVSERNFTEIDATRFRQYGDGWSEAVHHGGLRSAARAVRAPSSTNRKQVAAERLMFPGYARRLTQRYRHRALALGYDLDDCFAAEPWQLPVR